MTLNEKCQVNDTVKQSKFFETNCGNSIISTLAAARWNRHLQIAQYRLGEHVTTPSITYYRLSPFLYIPAVFVVVNTRCWRRLLS